LHPAIKAGLYKSQEVVDIITVYEPDLEEWEEDLKHRRKNENK